MHNSLHFSNLDFRQGQFSYYVSQLYDPLAIYNEHAFLEENRVFAGLAARFSCALTAIYLIAATETSKFPMKLWEESPLGFSFKFVKDLVKSLHGLES